jgi:hypothetical protein
MGKVYAPSDMDILSGKIGQKRTKVKEDFDMEDDDGPQSMGQKRPRDQTRKR